MEPRHLTAKSVRLQCRVAASSLATTKLEEETGKKLRNGLYHTGDLGFVIKGELYVTGRKNDLIIVHGRNYYAHDLEFLINQVPGVYPGRVVAAGWFRPEVGSEDVVIIAESSSEVKSEQDQLKHTIKQVLLDTSGLLPFDVLLVAPGVACKDHQRQTKSGRQSGKIPQNTFDHCNLNLQ